jgi:hypothetical protein
MNIYFESNKENLIDSSNDVNNLINSNNNNNVINTNSNKFIAQDVQMLEFIGNAQIENLQPLISQQQILINNNRSNIIPQFQQITTTNSITSHTPILQALTSNSNDDQDESMDTTSGYKEIEDSLAMSPNTHISSSDLGSSFTMSQLANATGGTSVSNHTFKKTEWDVKKFENHVRNTYGDSTPMENVAPQLLNQYINHFFEYAKKGDGMEYEPESLIGYMNSFERYLKAKNYHESLLRSELFADTRTMLKKKRELVRTIGRLIRIKNKDTSALLKFYRNLFKEKGLLNRDNPDGLLAEVYLNNMIYFGEYLKEDKAWRGNLNLVWGDIIIEKDAENGLEYLTLSISVKRSGGGVDDQKLLNSQRKTGTQSGKLRAVVQSTTDLMSPRVYARQPALVCPVEAFRVFRARRPNNCLDSDSPFYLAPNQKSKPTSKIWYQALAMSCQRLDPLFYCMFKRSGVDLNSLASMTDEQQQNIVAAASQTAQETNDFVVWKSIREQVVQQQLQNPHPRHNSVTINEHFANMCNQNYVVQQQQPQNQTIVNNVVAQPEPVKEESLVNKLPFQIQVQVQIQVLSPMQRQLLLQQQQEQHEQHHQQEMNEMHQINNQSNSAIAIM